MEFVAQISSMLVEHSPEVSSLGELEATQLLIALGLIGSSAERHVQQAQMLDVCGRRESRFELSLIHI